MVGEQAGNPDTVIADDRLLYEDQFYAPIVETVDLGNRLRISRRDAVHGNDVSRRQ